MGIKCICQNCHKEFERFPRDIKRGGGKYCSNDCAHQGRKKGGNRIFMGDYWRVYLPGGKTIAEHRMIMEKKIGRFLLPGELVHHIDGNKTNNSIENLEIVNPSKHSQIHNGLNQRWAILHEKCRECGTVIIPHLANGLCRKCYGRNSQREWRINHKDNRKSHKKIERGSG